MPSFAFIWKMAVSLAVLWIIWGLIKWVWEIVTLPVFVHDLDAVEAGIQKVTRRGLHWELRGPLPPVPVGVTWTSNKVKYWVEMNRRGQGWRNDGTWWFCEHDRMIRATCACGEPKQHISADAVDSRGRARQEAATPDEEDKEGK